MDWRIRRLRFRTARGASRRSRRGQRGVSRAGRRALRRHVHARAACTSAKPPCPAAAWASRPPPASAGRWCDWASNWPASRPARRRESTAAPSTSSKTELQPGDEQPEPFSFLTERIDTEQIPCWITYTTPEVHELIRANLHRAPMFSGQIQSTGPRYCPSIETKIVRFAEKPRHQLFLEPEGRHTHEVYVNGLSTSLPRDVQDAMLRLIPGLEARRNPPLRICHRVRLPAALAVEAVAGDQARGGPVLRRPGQRHHRLRRGRRPRTHRRRQCGAGAAAASEPLVLGRDQAYIGVMIDDLVTRGVDEPYRMFTSRAEYRLLLRPDNADRRLTPLAHRLGLVDQPRWERLQAKEAEIDRVTQLLETTHSGPVSLAKLLRRPEVTWEEIVARLPELADVPRRVGGTSDLRRQVRRLHRPAAGRHRPAAAAGRTPHPDPHGL